MDFKVEVKTGVVAGIYHIPLMIFFFLKAIVNTTNSVIKEVGALKSEV